jgi:GT2 family glycosyltransferase
MIGNTPHTTPQEDASATPAIDLVVATVGRTTEPTRLLEALTAQTFRAFRVIVVDQNEDERLAPVLARFTQALRITHLRAPLGVSRARNLGLGHVTADLVAFPDDDCWYSPDLLHRVTSFFSTHPRSDGIGGRITDERGRTSAGRPDTGLGPMTIFNAWKRTALAALFVRRALLERIGQFDESLGPGAGTPWGAGEDLDYVLRSLQAGLTIDYDPTLTIHHPPKREHTADPDIRQGFDYGAGYGRVLRKSGVPWWFAAYSCVRAFGGAVLSLGRGNTRMARFYWAVGRGRVRGWRAAKTSS